MDLEKYSFGIGDRFGRQGEAQLKAVMLAAEQFGVEIAPVWNKSNREHEIIHSSPSDVRDEADEAVRAMAYTGQYFVDADHVTLSSVDRFIKASDFFTLDVADCIGSEATGDRLEAFVTNSAKYAGLLHIPGIDHPFEIAETDIRRIGRKFLYAIEEAGRIYRHIEAAKGRSNFIVEVSMDEVSEAQSPVELFFILSGLAAENIPLQTIAPKFTGRFNKGVDYVGDVSRFEKEFEHDLLIINYAVKEFGLPASLKPSIHSGSDKFAIYPAMGRLIKKHDCGIHVKTAGTTWLEELIGLAVSDDGAALELIKTIYAEAVERFDELCRPYASVIDIDCKALPRVDEVYKWTGEKFANSLRHVPGHADYNSSLRQLMHVAYKIAACHTDDYTAALERNKNIVGQQVTTNLYERHLKLLFEA